MAEWNRRVTQLTRATQQAVEQARAQGNDRDVGEHLHLQGSPVRVDSTMSGLRPDCVSVCGVPRGMNR